MANKDLFRSIVGKLLPAADAHNEEGGLAYAMDPRHALAQYAATGCLNATFYASAQDQLAKVLELANAVEPEFVARAALFARQRGRMKDLPALLCAVLSVRSPGLLAEVFDRVIDSPKMLRNFVQIVRSGVVGRKSLGSLPKRLIVQWLDARGDEQLFRDSVGNDPSLADIVRMVHPRPRTPQREALYARLIGRPVQDESLLPPLVRQLDAYKAAADRRGLQTPDVPFQMLTALDLADWEWQSIARHAGWQMTRMNLNTFARHGVLDSPEMVRLIADRLRDPELIRKAGALPYQLMVAYGMAIGLPTELREALQDAMEIATSSVPKIDGKVYVFPDVSGSMHSPITGHRTGATTAVRCVDVAALIAAAIVRRNPAAVVIPFHQDAVTITLNGRDSVMTNAQRLASLPAGGTNCSAPLHHLNRVKARGDLVVYVSDYESWVDSPLHGRFGGSPTATMAQWNAFKERNPTAKMVCIDLQPYGTVQAIERPNIVNIGGFSDAVFDLLADVAAGGTAPGHWVRQIEAVSI